MAIEVHRDLLRKGFSAFEPNLYTGGNLIRNGFGEARSNDNFSQFAFATDYTAEGLSSVFKTPIGSNVMDFPIGDDYIACNAFEKLQISLVWIQGERDGSNFNGTLSQYAYVRCFDSGKAAISDAMSEEFLGSTHTTLAAPLNNGDTTITLGNATGWAGSAQPWWQRRIALWPWLPSVNSYGYIDAGGLIHSPYTLAGAISSAPSKPSWSAISGNVITLNPEVYPSGWSGGSYQAGTPVRNAAGGGAHPYFISVVPGSPGVYRFSKTFSSDRAKSCDLYLRRGTRYIRLHLYANYPGGGARNIIRLGAPYLRYVWPCLNQSGESLLTGLTKLCSLSKNSLTKKEPKIWQIIGETTTAGNSTSTSRSL